MTKDQRIQYEIEQQNLKIKQKQEEMLNFVSAKTVMQPKTGQSVEQLVPINYNTAAVSQNYIIHKVLPNDTLDRISIIYNVPKDAIRKTNMFTGDEIFMKKELIIPNSSNIYNYIICIQMDLFSEVLLFLKNNLMNRGKKSKYKVNMLINFLVQLI